MKTTQCQPYFLGKDLLRREHPLVRAKSRMLSEAVVTQETVSLPSAVSPTQLQMQSEPATAATPTPTSDINCC